jgi:methionyl-tRNA synthetase
VREGAEHPPLGALPRKQATVIFSPVNLTANGRSHLGHVGGPLLRMDVLARSLKRAGHEVWSGLTTDGFENHVLVEAARSGEDPALLAHRYHLRIGDDLGAVGIRFECFEDAAHPDHIADFEAVKDELVRELTAGGQVVLRDEQLPVDDALPESAAVEDRFAIGGWLSADCPECGSPAGSFFCETCGAHFEPYQASEPASRRGTITRWAENRSWFLRLAREDSLPRLWRDMMVEAPFAHVARRHLDKRGPTMRLTVPGRYGLEWHSPDLVNRQVCFSYSSLLYAHHLYCGRRYAEMASATNPFSRESDALLLTTMGIDITIPMLVGVSGCALAQETYRPFDRTFFNHFLRLEGDKFSTSRGHVIWAGEIAAIDGLNVDLLRTYLAEICPEEGEADLRLNDLLDRHNELLVLVRDNVGAGLGLLDAGSEEPGGVDDGLLRALEALYREQSTALSTECLRISRASRPVTRWLEAAASLASPESAYTWLKGFAFLASPLMPDLARALWRRLGHDGAPSCADFLERPRMREGPVEVPGRSLGVADLEPCVPRSVAV